MIDFLFTAVVFFIMLNILVFVHELGHFLVAKRFGIGVDEFGFGLPPRLFGKKVGKTIYSINALPIGGFVRLKGEDNAENSKTQKWLAGGKIAGEPDWEKYFFARPKWQRAAVLLAGVSMNFLLAVIIISYLFTQGILIPNGIKVEEVIADSPAAASLKSGDVILKLNGKEILDVKEFSSDIKAKGDQSVDLLIERVINGKVQQLTVAVTPRAHPPKDQGALGVKISPSAIELKYPWYQAPYYGMVWAVRFSWEMLTKVFELVFNLVTFKHVDTENLAGPIGIAQATGQAIKFGINAVLQLTGLLSLNLAIFNLLPIPALDGGRLFFVLFEKWIGRHVKPRVEAITHQVGFAFLLALIVLITINDLVRLFSGKGRF